MHDWMYGYSGLGEQKRITVIDLVEPPHIVLALPFSSPVRQERSISHRLL